MELPVAESELFDVEEAGRALGVSVSTVWRMIRSGRLASVRKRGRRLIPGRLWKPEFLTDKRIKSHLFEQTIPSSVSPEPAEAG